jgi:hypothetical protein
VPEKKKRTALWGILLVVALLGGGAAYYLNTQSDAKGSGQGPVITVSTAVVGLGDLNATVRVNGTVAAQNFAAMLDGFHAMDEHFRTAPLERNLPALMGLLCLWYNDFFDAQTVAVCPTSTG